MFVCCSDNMFDAVCDCSKENSNKLEESVRCILPVTSGGHKFYMCAF